MDLVYIYFDSSVNTLLQDKKIVPSYAG